MIENTIEKLNKRMENSLLCVGLDPDLDRIDTKGIEHLSPDGKVLWFVRNVIKATAPHVCAYKIQKAFFDLLPQGHLTLTKVIESIHVEYPDIPVFIDCKVGDIENTMRAYLQNLFDNLGADGIVVNPYMGDDVLKFADEYPDKAFVILVKTSNPGGSVVQDVVTKQGEPLWRHILKLVVSRDSKSNMIPVISSTASLHMSEVRKDIPDGMPILLAGVGTQGGSLDGLSELLNSERSGVFVNSSRGIIYADNVEQAAIDLKEELNAKR